MRLLIAGGGTGGHIYPALAVARSLRARAGAPELGWLGGHRGLEGDIVPPAGIPLRRLLAALAPLGRSRHPPRPRSRPPRALGPAGAGAADRPAPGGDLHDRRLRGHPGAAGGRGPAHPQRAVGRQRDPRPERPPGRAARHRGHREPPRPPARPWASSART